MNQDTRLAQDYHGQTKHSYWSVRSNQHRLEWDNQPLPFKIYEGLAPIALPKEALADMPAVEAIANGGAERGEADRQAIPDLAELAQLFFLSNGITRVIRRGGIPHYFRAASCTGALYHIELYLACGDLPGLPAGVYHYGAHDHALRPLRAGDYRQAIVEAAGNEPHLAQAPAVMLCSDTFWRNTWKYQARAYRHSGWDCGVILANLLAMAAADGVPAQVVSGFADQAINRLLGIDGEKEAAVALVALGRSRAAIPAAGVVTPLDLPSTPLSQYEVDYPLIQQIHAASSLEPGEVTAWRGQPPLQLTAAPAGALFPLKPLPEDGLPEDRLSAVIRRRGSTRQFTREAITFEQLSTLLVRSTRGIPADFLEPLGSSLNEVYLIANAVEGLPSGAYYYRRDAKALEQVREGDFRQQAGYLDLEQALAEDAALNIYYLAALGPILERFGNRGYRAVELEAGILGGKVYLLAYALGLGATGLTFYDDEVIQFFAPHAAGKSAIFLMAVGHPFKRHR